MDFAFTEEQNMLGESLARFIEREYGFEKRRTIQASGEGFSREVWAAFADMGLLGLPFAEEHGGFGGSAVDTLLVMQALGRGLVVEPYWATVVMAGSAIRIAGSAAQKAALLPAIAGGERIFAWAHGEPASRYDLAHVATRATPDGAGYVLDGAKAVVLFGAQADSLIVSARSAGAATDGEGISLFVVDRNTPGVTVRDYRTLDGLRAAEIKLTNVKLGADALLGVAGKAYAVIEEVRDLGLAALCAEGVGLMEALNAATLDYLKTRQQFGQPIGRFQALQHRAVDMMIHAEQSKSLAYLAAMRAAGGDAGARSHAVAAAKAYVGRAARRVAEEAIQLHGGMGVTDELAASHYAKRLVMLDFMQGDADHHLARFAAMSAG
jgi:alkylation response protein AidB-like acyl-CoA dehydrogenase